MSGVPRRITIHFSTALAEQNSADRLKSPSVCFTVSAQEQPALYWTGILIYGSPGKPETALSDLGPVFCEGIASERNKEGRVKKKKKKKKKKEKRKEKKGSQIEPLDLYESRS